MIMENKTITPDKWVVLELKNRIYKVFGSWGGGYLSGDVWKLNSGIKRVEQDEDFYYFYGFSGSCYKCRKTNYGVATSYSRAILQTIIDKGAGSVKQLPDVSYWTHNITNNN